MNLTMHPMDLSHIIAAEHGGALCSVCAGAVQRDALSCPHCAVAFFGVAQVQSAYYIVLQALKADPASVDLRQRALSFGQTYVDLSRTKPDGARYDQATLAHDIAAATTPIADAPVDTGLVSAQEFAGGRQKAVGQLEAHFIDGRS